MPNLPPDNEEGDKLMSNPQPFNVSWAEDAATPKQQMATR
jgi:hypothetical protein